MLQHPANGVILSISCISHKLVAKVAKVANGRGGSYERDIEVTSPQCGYKPKLSTKEIKVNKLIAVNIHALTCPHISNFM